jgi:ketosteroid isomerase-like protein/quercetin dioxygenase-like cupin family protein
MRHRTLVGAMATLGIIGAGITAGFPAKSIADSKAPGDSPQRVEQKRADFAGTPKMEVVASIAEYKPGEAIERHTHHGVEVAYVIQGARVQSPGKDPVLLATGATVINSRDVQHAGFTVVGETPLKLFTVHVVDKGKPLYDYAEREGDAETMSDESTEEKAVLATDDEWVRAELAQDETALRRILDDRFVFNSNAGRTSGKEDLIQDILSGDMKDQQVSERSAVVDGDTAVVFGTAELRFAANGQEERTSRLRYTATYVKREGQWRALAIHMAKRTAG